MPIALDGVSNSTDNDLNVTSFSWNHTVTTIDNTIIVIGVATRNVGAGEFGVSNVTYGGYSCTQIREDEYFQSASKSSALFYLVDPPSGSNAVVVTFEGQVYRANGGAVSMTGVHQISPINAHNGVAGSTGTSVSTSITTTVDDCWIIDSLCVRSPSSTSTSSQTQRWNYLDTGNNVNGAGSSKVLATAGTTSMAWTAASNAGWSHSICAVTPYSAPPEGGGGSTTNFYKVEQLTEQSTTSTTFIDVPGCTLTFAPESTSETWMIFASGVCRSSSNTEQAFEMRLTVDGVEEDLWSHQNNTATTPNGAGFLVFDRISGVDTLQTIKVQYRALTGTVYCDDVRVVAALVPDGADFQYYESDGIVSSTGSNLTLGSLTFTPSSTGNYFIIGSIKHREHPSGSTSQTWFEGSDGSLHPNAPSGVYHSNAREPWNPNTCVWRENLTATSKTFNIRFTSSGSGSQASEHRYRKFMAFREDAWDTSNYNLAATNSTTTSGTYVQKNSITTTAPPVAQDYLSIQTARIGGGSTSTSVQKSGELRIGGSALVRTNHRINRNDSNTQGYHHTIGLVDVRNTASALTYENGYLSPNAISVSCAESAIVILRYAAPVTGPVQTHQIMM